MPSASLPPWAVRVSAPGGRLVGCIEVRGIAVAIRKQRGYANLLLEVLMRNGKKRSARPVDSGTRDIGRATEHAVALASELAAQAGPARGEPVVQPPTYGQLLEEIDRRGSNAQNRKSQLRSWMRNFGFVEDDEIGDEFGAALDIYLDKFRAALEAQGKAPSTIAPYLSRIREIHAVALELRRIEVTAPTFACVFHAAIKASGVRASRVAKVAGVNKRTIQAWRAGTALPGCAMHEPMGAVEALLGLAPGTLTELISQPEMKRRGRCGRFGEQLRSAIQSRGRTAEDVARESGCPASTLRSWLRGGEPNVANRAFIPCLEVVLAVEAGVLESLLRPPHPSTLRYAARLNPAQQSEWDRFFARKTNLAEPDPERRPNEYWRVRKDGRCPTAESALAEVGRFYGCLAQPVDADDPRQRGLGLPVEGLSLMSFANRKYVEFSVNFRAKRSGGFGGSAVKTITFAASLLREGTGYLWQGDEIDWRSYPVELLEGQPAKCRGEITLECWRAHCVYVYRRLWAWLDHLKTNGLLKPLRRYEHIDTILRMERPMKALVLLEKRMKHRYARLWGRAPATARARMMRDLVLVSMITRNPLRAEQWAEMTVGGEDQPGHLRKGPDGNYYLYISASEFKATAGFRGDDYEAAVSPELTPLLDDYLAKFRPLLAGANQCPLLLRPQRKWHHEHQPDHDRPVNVTSIFMNVTSRFLPDYCTRGFGPHAWRHIIATHLVKNYSDGVRLAADALHNTEKMIEKHYGHLRSKDRTDRSHRIIQAELDIDKGEMGKLLLDGSTPLEPATPRD